MLMTEIFNIDLLLTYQSFYGRGPVMRVHKTMLKNILAFRNELPILNLKSTLVNLRKTLSFFFECGKISKVNMFLTPFTSNLPNSIFVQRWMPGFLTNYRLYISIYSSSINLFGLAHNSKGLAVLFTYLTINSGTNGNTNSRDWNINSKTLLPRRRFKNNKEGRKIKLLENRTARKAQGFLRNNSITKVNGFKYETKYRYRSDPGYQKKKLLLEKRKLNTNISIRQEYKIPDKIHKEVGGFPVGIFITPYKNMPLREGLRTGINTGGFVDAHVDSGRYFYPLIGNENNVTFIKFIVCVFGIAKENGVFWSSHKSRLKTFYDKFPNCIPKPEVLYYSLRNPR